MANRTVKDANSIHGTNPQYLVGRSSEPGFTTELVVDKAMELKFVGGVFGGNIKPTPFLCLTLKMLQIQPEKDIIVEFIKNEDFKYVRLLGAMYMRLTGTAVDCYKYLEPLYNDYRKIKTQNRNGGQCTCTINRTRCSVSGVQYHQQNQQSVRVIGPSERQVYHEQGQKRQVLEEAEMLEPRVSALEEDLDEVESSEEERTWRRRWSESRVRSLIAVVTETVTDRADLRLPDTAAAGHREGTSPLLRSALSQTLHSHIYRAEESLSKETQSVPRRERHRSKSPDATEVAPEREDTGPSLQDITEATDTGVTQSLQKEVQRKATRKAVDTSDSGLFTELFANKQYTGQEAPNVSLCIVQE
ncbi:hypothetical protein WMY93_032106 [Mugilogobius chulae]|uniref:Pre-mRNA-splicing factor 38B n=1 Tax=Mugilogobius chulae TaxID=88201 RepID=A0AAW0MGE9_9GOBI